LPATTVDIPPDLLQFIDELVSRGIARSRREIVVSALSYYQKYTMFDWSDDRILVRKLRRALMTQKGVQQLTSKLSDQEFYEAGKRMAQTLLDSLLASFGKDAREPDNYRLVMQLLSDLGWGEFTLTENRIVANSPFMHKQLLRGYLEHGLGLQLRLVPTIEDLAIFEIESRQGAKVGRTRNN
jgi:Arc/MetJ-type ribon-helix-helix transcriptional regulator